MVTKMKKVKIITIVLAIILVALVAFGGVYIKTQNRMENKVKDYDLARDLKGGRVVELKVATGDDSKNNTENLTVENYETVKKTIEKRLNNLGAQDYTISLNKEDGTIIVELSENTATDTYVYFLTADGKVQIKEKDTDTELLSVAMVKKVTYSYKADADGKYQVYMELQLTKDGQAKIEEIKNDYAVLASEIEEIEAAAKENENEDGEAVEGEEVTTETEDTVETRKIAKLTIGTSEYDIDSIEKDIVKINIGSATSNSTNVNNYINVAAELALLINSGKYPVNYEMGDNRFVHSDITTKQLTYFAIAVAIIILIIFIVFTIEYKTKGLLVSISCIGFISVLLLLLRYTNVNISIEGIAGIILVLSINFIISENILNESIDYKKIVLNLIPVAIITLVFCFAKWSNLSSFGLIMFWGLVLIAVYNLVVTKTLLKLKESK